jgi:RNA polymerase sigma-70 factor (ECF subfamily)
MSDDWACLERARQGDENSWQILIDRHALRLTRMTCIITGSTAAAQDLVQETFLEVFRKAPRHEKGSFSAYLGTIAYHKALKEKKRLQLVDPLDGIDIPDRHGTPLEGMLSKERDHALVEVLNSLDMHHRAILVMRFYGEYSYEEIARMTELPLGTIKSRIFYAVKTCRERLNGKGILE